MNGIRKRTRSIFDIEWLYFHWLPALIAGLLTEGVGLCLVGIDVSTNHSGAYNIIMSISGKAMQASKQYLTGINIFGWVLALVPITLFLMMLLRVGRHYPTREAQMADATHGLNKSIASEGADFMLELFMHFNHWLPILLGIFGIITTVIGLMGFEQPDPSQFWWAILVDTVIACVIYALGPQFILVGFHYFHSVARTWNMDKRINQATQLPSPRSGYTAHASSGGSGQKMISGPSQQGPSFVSRQPAGRLDPKALEGPKGKDALLKSVQKGKQQSQSDDPITGEWETIPELEDIQPNSIAMRRSPVKN